MSIHVEQIRKDFPILYQQVNGHPLIYLDNAATSQKPQVVIDALSDYYTQTNSNVHRGVHTLAATATEQFEATRETARAFIQANSAEEIIITKGTTESINLVANTFGWSQVQAGDEVIISTMEHHANIVPWQILCERKGATLKIIPMNDTGELLLEEYEKLLSERTKIVAVVHTSNVLGTVNDIEYIIKKAREYGAYVLVDGAQSAPRFEVNVKKIDCDFYVFSSHKVYGPTGIGILYGKKEILEQMPPFLVGGEMIKDVSFKKTTYNELPYKFEAGTPNIADTIAFKTAMDYMNLLGKANIATHEQELLYYATEKLSAIKKIKIIGTSKSKVSLISFVVDGVHHFDLGMMLDAKGIAIRTGHHCAQPLMSRYRIDGTARVSFAIYNTKEEIDSLTKSIEEIIHVL